MDAFGRRCLVRGAVGRSELLPGRGLDSRGRVASWRFTRSLQPRNESDRGGQPESVSIDQFRDPFEQELARLRAATGERQWKWLRGASHRRFVGNRLSGSVRFISMKSFILALALFATVSQTVGYYSVLHLKGEVHPLRGMNLHFVSLSPLVSPRPLPA